MHRLGGDHVGLTIGDVAGHGIPEAVCNRRTRALRYAKAGHPLPLLIRGDGRSIFLDKALSPPLGPVQGSRYAESALSVHAGDTLILYTGGLIERAGEILDVGMDGMSALAGHTAGLGVQELCERFLHHQPYAGFPDDRALTAVRFPRVTELHGPA